MNVWKKFLCCAAVALAASGLCVRTYAQFGATDAAESKNGKQQEKSMLAEGQKEVIEAKQQGREFCRCIGETESAAAFAKIEQALSGPLHSNGIEFTDTPLNDVATSLQDDYGIPIQFDAIGLDEAGIGIDSPVTISLRNISVRSALKLMLKRLQLTYVIEDEVLLITTKQEADSQLKTCVYDVGTLAGERDADFDSIIDTIVSCVATDTWSENGGGQAEIRPIKPGLLVISQTRGVHEEIRSLLATLRKMKETHIPSANAAAENQLPAEDVVTRSYSLQLDPTNDVETMRNQVRELITASLPEETWSGRLASGEGVTLSVFHDRIVVRQTPEVQKKVQKILAESGVATPTAAADMAEARRGAGRSSGGPGGGGGVFRPIDGGAGAADDPFGSAPRVYEAVGPGGGDPGFSSGPAGIAPEPGPNE